MGKKNPHFIIKNKNSTDSVSICKLKYCEFEKKIVNDNNKTNFRIR